jgi:hypothetical protein
MRNRYPLEQRFGYDGYAFRTNFQAVALALLASAYEWAGDNLEECLAPADATAVGAGVFSSALGLAAWSSAAGYVELLLRPVPKMDPMGVARVMLRNAPFPLAMPSALQKASGCGKGCVDMITLGPFWLARSRKGSVFDESVGRSSVGTFSTGPGAWSLDDCEVTETGIKCALLQESKVLPISGAVHRVLSSGASLELSWELEFRSVETCREATVGVHVPVLVTNDGVERAVVTVTGQEVIGRHSVWGDVAYAVSVSGGEVECRITGTSASPSDAYLWSSRFGESAVVACVTEGSASACGGPEQRSIRLAVRVGRPGQMPHENGGTAPSTEHTDKDAGTDDRTEEGREFRTDAERAAIRIDAFVSQWSLVIMILGAGAIFVRFRRGGMFCRARS